MFFKAGPYVYSEQGYVSYSDYVLNELRKNYVEESEDGLASPWVLGASLRRAKEHLDSSWIDELVRGTDLALLEQPLPDCLVSWQYLSLNSL